MKFNWLLSFACSLIFAAVLHAEGIEVRLNPSFYDEGQSILYVDIELKYNGQGIWVLADQNYRLYYDSQNLSFIDDNYRPDLPQDLYSSLKFNEIIRDADASGVGPLKFETNLGFLNFNVDLTNDALGGVRLRAKDGWSRVVTLKFKLNNPKELNEIVWSTRGRTDEYATAFIEIMEWKAPRNLVPAIIESAGDVQFEYVKAPDFQMTIGPNPAADFITISWSEALTKGVDIKLTDAQGREVKKEFIRAGFSSSRIDISELPVGAFQVTFFDKGELVATKSIVKAE